MASFAPMIWSRTTFAASIRACRSSRVDAPEAVEISAKLKQIETTLFFIWGSFSLRPVNAARIGFQIDNSNCTGRITSRCAVLNQVNSICADGVPFLPQRSCPEFSLDCEGIATGSRGLRENRNRIMRGLRQNREPIARWFGRASGELSRESSRPRPAPSETRRAETPRQQENSQRGTGSQKIGVPRPHGENGALELLSSDLRCFYQQFPRKDNTPKIVQFCTLFSKLKERRPK